ncbi:MAG: DPP IV N-terminal domain-containing protein, partial [Alistipes sp.]|nr:DPP IV N-terminal domain-containing protein [Alistipes sp.]
MLRKFFLFLLGVCLLGAAQARGEYDRIARLRAMNRRVGGIRSMSDGEHYTVIEQNNIVRYAYATAGPGQKLLPEPLVSGIADYAFSPDERSVLIASGRTPIYRHSYTTRYWLFDGRALQPVLAEAAAPRDASFSPDGRSIVYSDRNDLYLY